MSKRSRQPLKEISKFSADTRVLTPWRRRSPPLPPTEEEKIVNGLLKATADHNIQKSLALKGVIVDAKRLSAKAQTLLNDLQKEKKEKMKTYLLTQLRKSRGGSRKTRRNKKMK